MGPFICLRSHAGCLGGGDTAREVLCGLELQKNVSDPLCTVGKQNRDYFTADWPRGWVGGNKNICKVLVQKLLKDCYFECRDNWRMILKWISFYIVQYTLYWCHIKYISSVSCTYLWVCLVTPGIGQYVHFWKFGPHYAKPHNFSPNVMSLWRLTI